jgi:hypothetical protein
MDFGPDIIRFDLRPIPVGFVVDLVALGLVSARVLLFSIVSIIPPIFGTHISLTTTDAV